MRPRTSSPPKEFSGCTDFPKPLRVWNLLRSERTLEGFPRIRVWTMTGWWFQPISDILVSFSTFQLSADGSYEESLLGVLSSQTYIHFRTVVLLHVIHLPQPHGHTMVC